MVTRCKHEAIPMANIKLNRLEDMDNELQIEEMEGSQEPIEKTEFRLGLVGIVFIIAGALMLIVPGTLSPGSNKDVIHMSPSSSGFFITGGVMFGLGVLMVVVNMCWCCNEQKIAANMSQSKMKIHDGNQKAPQCAYHSLPAETTQPPRSPKERSHDHHNHRTRHHHHGNNVNSVMQHEPSGIFPLHSGNAQQDMMYSARYPTDNESISSSLRNTMFDNPSYLSDTLV